MLSLFKTQYLEIRMSWLKPRKGAFHFFKEYTRRDITIVKLHEDLVIPTRNFQIVPTRSGSALAPEDWPVILQNCVYSFLSHTNSLPDLVYYSSIASKYLCP
jgi:hypothetical protein